MKNRIKIFGVLLLSLSIFFVACEDKSDLTAPTMPSTGSADFSTFVSIGNSLTAGYQNGALYQSSQNYSIGKMISNQLSGVNYAQPTVDDPGLGTSGRMEIESLTGPVIVNNPNFGNPNNISHPAPYNNLGVPGALLYEVLNTTDMASSATQQNAMFDLVLRGQGSTMLQQAVALNPTFMTVWVGNNDVLGYATMGGVLPGGFKPTDAAFFDQMYKTMVEAIANTNTNAVFANIPDVKSVPYFTTVGPAMAVGIEGAMAQNPQIQGLVYQYSIEGVPVNVATPDQLKNGDVLVTLSGSPFAGLLGDTDGKYYQLSGDEVPPGVDTSMPFGFHPLNPWPNKLILDDNEIQIVVKATSDFNTTISAAVASKSTHFKLVDIHGFFNKVAENGYVADGLIFSTSYILGNLFSLDGVHPTTRGYAIVANEFIKVINSGFNASIPYINVSTVPASIPLTNWPANKISELRFEPNVFDNVLF